jgi:hypothetical protein
MRVNEHFETFERISLYAINCKYRHFAQLSTRALPYRSPVLQLVHCTTVQTGVSGTLYAWVLHVSDPEVCRVTGCLVWCFSWFSLAPPGDFRTIPWNRSQPRESKTLPTHGCCWRNLVRIYVTSAVKTTSFCNKLMPLPSKPGHI